jgi:hypothetical protein
LKRGRRRLSAVLAKRLGKEADLELSANA